jgi:hypothetical protein
VYRHNTEGTGKLSGTPPSVQRWMDIPPYISSTCSGLVPRCIGTAIRMGLLPSPYWQPTSPLATSLRLSNQVDGSDWSAEGTHSPRFHYPNHGFFHCRYTDPHYIPTMDSSTVGTLTQSIFTTIPDITTNLLRSWCLLCMRIVNHRRRLLKQEMQTNHTRHRIKEPS